MSDAGPARSYRCVCGHVFPISLQAGGECPACGRRVSATVFSGGMAPTLSCAWLADGEPVGDLTVGDAPAGEVAVGDLIGRRFGHFRIIRPLGHGGMGAVFQALDESLERYVALKVIHTAGRSDVDTRQVQRLMQEAIAQARVNHPHIVHIYYVGREDRTPFLAMELVGGPTVAARLAAGPLPFAEVVTLALQVADALRHAAEFDIVHGDIKPSNLLMAAAATVKLSDFGLACRLSDSASGCARLAGTPNYLPPEAAASQPLDIRSDMYALGVTLFEMTFGRLPYTFSGSTLSDYLRIHRTAPIEFPEPWPDSVPWGWRALLDRLLAKVPADRFPDYDALLAALRKLRPVALPKAGRVQRGLAWLVDLALAFAAQQLFYGVLSGGNLASGGNIPRGARWFLALAGGVVPLAASYLQAWWKTTPGKRLFQLRIVDRYGLAPAPAVFGARMVIQLLPLWGLTAWHLLDALGLRSVGGLLSAALAFGLLADTATALFARAGRSLHDRLFGTHVVLDVDAHA